MAKRKIIFLFSLPRSGSTLLQRILASHSRIATVPESWFLLTLFHPLSRKKAYAEYSYPVLRKALNHFVANLAEGKVKYYQEVNQFSSSLYDSYNFKEPFFLEKTPRYHLISEHIVRAFPEAKFIYLARNPLSVASSISSTWRQNKWNLNSYLVDLEEGLQNLNQSYRAFSDRMHLINYENLVSRPVQELTKLLSYLGLEFEEECVSSFTNVKMDGMGDHTGIHDYSKVEKKSIDKWRANIVNPLRVNWMKRYLWRIGADNLEMMGYDHDHLQKQMSSNTWQLKFLATDIYQMPIDYITHRIKQYILNH